MTPQEQKTFLSATARFIAEEIAKATEPLRERIADLQRMMEEWGYKGTWEEGVAYRSGNFVSLSGSMWICLAEKTATRPDTSNPDWAIAVKRGRDAPRAEPRRPTAATPTRHNA